MTPPPPFRLRALVRGCLLALTFLTLAPALTAQEPAEGASQVAEDAEAEPAVGIDERINAFMAPITKWVFKFVFVGIDLEDGSGAPVLADDGSVMELPLILLWLVGAAVIVTLVFRFVNIWGLPLALRTIRGKYSRPDDPGEITHFQALTAALSATVGLGNIAGVAIAVAAGGPGAVFWMIVVGVLGMTSKFAECTLGVKYRKIIAGKVYGGPMYYLRDGLAERDMSGLGKVLAVLFAVMCVGAALGGGNMFQANQSCSQLLNVSESAEHARAKSALAALQKERASLVHLVERIESLEMQAAKLEVAVEEANGFEWRNARLRRDLDSVLATLAIEQQALGEKSEAFQRVDALIAAKEKEVEASRGFFDKQRWIFGLVMAVLVGLVIIGGIVGIAKVTSRLVPVMTVTYILGCVIVLLVNFQDIPYAARHIVSEAFHPEAVAGGFIGAFIQGIRRAAFSNEAGFGSAPIAHAAVKTRYPASEGMVALLEPLMDTVVVCTMTGLAIVVTASQHQYVAPDGIALTSTAFETVMPWFKFILLACVILFAFSTMISWSYYGQQAWSFLFGPGRKRELVYKLLFCFFVVIGASLSLGSVLDFADGMLFAMSLFNLLGLYILLPVVMREHRRYRDYVQRVDAGETEAEDPAAEI